MNSTLPNDTDPEIEAILIAGYRAMSAAEKAERVSELTKAVQEMALLDVRRRHPDEGEREHSLRVASRWLDPDVMKRVFGWNVDEVGY
jgi:hypothetical protein